MTAGFVKKSFSRLPIEDVSSFFEVAAGLGLETDTASNLASSVLYSSAFLAVCKPLNTFSTLERPTAT